MDTAMRDAPLSAFARFCSFSSHCSLVAVYSFTVAGAGAALLPTTPRPDELLPFLAEHGATKGMPPPSTPQATTGIASAASLGHHPSDNVVDRGRVARPSGTL